MASFNQQELAYRVLSANQCSVMVGDQLVAFAQTSSPSLDFGSDTFYGIGSAKPQEVMQLRFSMALSLDSLKLTKEGQTFFGESTPLSYILANNSFDIFLLDQGGNAFLSYVGCVASNIGTNLSSNSAISESISFMAMDILDDTGTSILDGQNALNINFVASSAGAASTPTAA